ncbi:MAG: ParB/RepB/Spo0J family partition protein [Roseiflexaceae bacterium]|nr:ParB/RepB/Spo0J family partition protein [Roseiflexaceae bacterium]
MIKGKPRLGSGLSALLPDEPRSGVRMVSVDQIRQNPRQPRAYFDEAALDELANSIREHGIIQPLLVSEHADGFELIAGERRWRAAQRAGLLEVPLIVRETTPQQLLELALIENVQRADLNAIEEARAYHDLHTDFNLTDAQIAARVGKNNRVTVANTRRLLNLPLPAQDAILKHTITAGHGRALLTLDGQEQQLTALEAVIDDELSVREVEELGDLAKKYEGDIARAIDTIRRKRASRVGAGRGKTRDQPLAPASQDATSSDDREIGREMQKVLGTPVSFTRNGRELRVTITFYDDEKLQEFYELLSK